MRFSVVICAYTEARWEALVAAVASVRAQTAPPEEIIVVIDHNDALLARAVSAFVGTTVIANARTRGLSGARNSGIAAASGEYCRLPRRRRDRRARLAGATRRGLPRRAGARRRRRDGAALGGRATGLFPAESAGGRTAPATPGSPRRARRCADGTACNMSVRREVFAAAGGFSDALGRVGTLPEGCERPKLRIRARQHWPGSGFLFLIRSHRGASGTRDAGALDYFRRAASPRANRRRASRGSLAPMTGFRPSGPSNT